MSDSEKSRFPKYAMLGSGRLLPRAHFMRLYIHFNSIQFISFQFYSIQRDEKNETLRMITKKTKYYEKNEILRKKRKLRNITKKRKYFNKKSRYRDILC